MGRGRSVSGSWRVKGLECREQCFRPDPPGGGSAAGTRQGAHPASQMNRQRACDGGRGEEESEEPHPGRGNLLGGREGGRLGEPRSALGHEGFQSETQMGGMWGGHAAFQTS